MVLFQLLIAFTAQAATIPPLQVFASTATLAAITRSVAGVEDVKVAALAPSSENLHHVKPTPELQRKLEKADLIILNGVGLEIGWLPHLIIGSGNAKIQENTPGFFDVGAKIRPYEIPQKPVDQPKPPQARVDGKPIDVHPLGNPHYLLDPEGAQIVADALAAKLGELRPAAAEVFKKNAAAFKTEVSQKAEDWRKQLSGWRGRGVLSYHRDWSYLMKWLGCEDTGSIEPRPGVPPSATELLELEARARTQRARSIWLETLDPVQAAQEISKAANAKVIVLPGDLSRVPRGKTYLDWMNEVVKRLRNS